MPPEVEVRRSARRRRTVTAYWQDDRIVVLIPSRFTRAEEQHWVDRMVQRLVRRGRTAPRGDLDLEARAQALSRRYLDGRARPASVRWVGELRTRWASCTPATRTIRLSRRLATLPDWVQDYVLVHELAHLLVAGHGPDFWALVSAYPRTERARGYLDGVSAAARLSFADDLAGDESAADESAGDERDGWDRPQA